MGISKIESIELEFIDPPPIYRYATPKSLLALRYLGIFGEFEG
jgi:hypothetical protein